ncbi:hypothetical protein ACQCU1_19075 [Sutcliffiella horikoshii]|uniref:hypothetical protein n=1 Tax=Sutcliffiella horikoshii TaxID=79883 RepID=UPI003CF59E87
MNRSKLIILGVGHSLQLISRYHHPGVFRTFFESVKPDAICIERSPEKYHKSDFYEFAYEQQFLTIPYALEKRIPLYPIDWLPTFEDDLLVNEKSPDHEEPPIIRMKNDFFKGHGCYPSNQILEFDFFFADKYSNGILKKDQEWLDIRKSGISDYWRRLVLYRNFMQAMRIKEVAKKHKGQTILVVIGAFHKPDLENILNDCDELEIVQPGTYEIKNKDEERHLLDLDLFAISTYNLLGVQSKYGVVDWVWLEEILKQLERSISSVEVMLLRTRYNILKGTITNEEAIACYKKISSASTYEQKLTFHGVKYQNRIDSYFDPFGYLSIKHRSEIEIAREYTKLRLSNKSLEIKKSILNSNNLSILQKAQIEGYWDEYVINMK